MPKSSKGPASAFKRCNWTVVACDRPSFTGWEARDCTGHRWVVRKVMLNSRNRTCPSAAEGLENCAQEKNKRPKTDLEGPRSPPSCLPVTTAATARVFSCSLLSTKGAVQVFEVNFVSSSSKLDNPVDLWKAKKASRKRLVQRVLNQQLLKVLAMTIFKRYSADCRMSGWSQHR